jgi:hypothetical protein
MDFLLSFLWLLAAIPVLYVYFAIVLTAIARKAGVGDTWMAWVPLANIVLMCRIAGKPSWYALLMLVPLLNLVFLVLIWMGIAKARGKSPMLGVLILVPLVNLALPPILASGESSRPSTTATASPPGPAVCPACGRAECVGEAFCGYTGQPIQVAARPAPTAAAPAAAAEGQPGVLAKVLLGVFLSVGASYVGIGLINSARKVFSGQPAAKAEAKGLSAQSTAALPQRMAGILTEFPVDTAGNPARPTSVVTQSFRTASRANTRATARPKLPPKSLPPGVTEASLPSFAESLTSASYQTGPSDSPVNVHVLSTAPGAGPQSRNLAQEVAAQSGPSAESASIHVQSPLGGDYTGYRVRTPDAVTYVLDKTGAPVVILIYAADPSAKPTADRLAGNVGNGNGLLDDPAVSASLAALPSQLPPGLQLADSQTYTGSSLSGSLDQVTGSLSGSFGPDARQWIDQVKRFIPPSLDTSRYVDASGHEYNMAVGDYGGAIKAWTTWQFLRATLGLSGAQSVPLEGGDAISSVSQGTQYLLFRRGTHLGIVSGPNDQTGRPLQLARGIRP